MSGCQCDAKKKNSALYAKWAAVPAYIEPVCGEPSESEPDFFQQTRRIAPQIAAFATAGSPMYLWEKAKRMLQKSSMKMCTDFFSGKMSISACGMNSR